MSEYVTFHRNFVTLEDFAELTIIETYSNDNHIHKELYQTSHSF